MRSRSSARPTVGVLVSWPVYYGASILRYLHTVLDGIYTAACAADCNLLLACGMDGVPEPRAERPAWPLPGADTAFVPVGPWNTDGLIAVAMYLNGAQETYLRGLADGGLPLVYTGFEGPGVSVNLDNAGGVRQALEHLHAHGHRRIAFIAGLDPPMGESGPRLQAYYDSMRGLGLPVDPRLVAHGDLVVEGGRRAMGQLLAAVDSGACEPFTAVLACNDSSAFGAAEVLQAHGLRIPDDIALVGFDNLLEARAHVPPLTTVHNPAFAVGQQSLRTLLDIISGQPPPDARIHVPVRLVVRRSCGCRSGVDRMGTAAPPPQGAVTCGGLVEAISGAVLLEVRSGRDAAQAMCRTVVDSLLASAQSGDGAAFEDALLGVLQQAEALGDDVHTWHVALAVLEQGLSSLQPPLPHSARLLAADLLERARLIVSERTRQQAARALLRQEELAVNLGQMSAELLATLDAPQIPAILAEHLPPLGVTKLLAALYAPEGDDPVARSQPILRYGFPTRQEAAEADFPGGEDFVTYQFPPALFAPDQPFRLALLPFAAQEVGSGFVAFDAGNLEPCAAIVRNLAAALVAGKLYADALHGRQQAEEAARLKSRFLSTVSHELRTPLNLIVGLSELLLREGPAAPALPDTMRRDLERIYTSGQHLAQLIGDVLDLASSEAGQLRLLREPLDLGDVLRPVALAGEQMAQEKGLAWQVRLPPSGPSVMGDRTRLRQVVLNLISNAVKFTGSGAVALTVDVHDGAAVVTVSDTGPGVPPSEQAAIFGEFERGGRTLAGRYGGLGLGLAICKQLVELHGGTIAVQSSGEEGAGAAFRFTLPALPTAPTMSTGAGATADAKTVLIVEDDPGILDLHTRLVRQLPAGHKVLQAAGGRQALALMQGTRPDLVLLDLRLPDLDGFGVLAAMRGQERLRDVPVVVLTAQSPVAAEMERLNAGVAAVLSKGVFSAEELLGHIEAALARTPKLGSGTQSLVRQALAYIHAHYAEPLGRKQIAACVGISEDYLTQCFHQELGITPITYLQRYRVQRARLLLEGGRCSVTEAALAVGFADLTYFGRVFQREAGVTPSAYRRGRRLNPDSLD